MMRALKTIASVLPLLLLWAMAKFLFHVPDRYFPSFAQVIMGIHDVGSELLVDTAITFLRICVGFFGGAILGVAAALYCYRASVLAVFMPSVNAIRAVPPVAMIPFFLLWFGFSEIGRLVLVFVGLGVNVFVAAAELMTTPRERDRILFMSFPTPARKLIWSFWLPRVLEGLLPTLRFGLATVVGLVIVAEMLGAQSGLGYLIQTSYETFSLHVILLATAILGIMTAVLDITLQFSWRNILYWAAR